MKDIGSVDDYMNLVTSEYAEAEKFNTMLYTFLEKNLDTVFLGMDMAEGGFFNLEVAYGDQLDKLGELVNVSRILPISDPDIPPVLDDDLYRKVIKARILANHWDGTLEGLFKILNAIFPDVAFEIIDNQNMTMNILVIDPNISPTDSALIVNGFILPKPSGVGVTYQIQTNALFGFDADTSFVQGWDKGIWNNT